jgi:hypothetical protein
VNDPVAFEHAAEMLKNKLDEANNYGVPDN